MLAGEVQGAFKVPEVRPQGVQETVERAERRQATALLVGREHGLRHASSASELALSPSALLSEPTQRGAEVIQPHGLAAVRGVPGGAVSARFQRSWLAASSSESAVGNSSSRTRVSRST